MGYLREKYTRTYYTHRDDKDFEVGYGAAGADEWRSGGLREELRETLDLVSLKDSDILEIGYGRGESARYLFERKKARSYVGVDFSEHAFALASETLLPFPKSLWQLHCADAIRFLAENAYCGCFDAVLMIDCIEHIPKSEVDEILPMLYRALRPGGHLIVFTPYYPVDEDFISQGFEYIAPTISDLIPETRGMHCNKFTRERLIREFQNCGFDFVRDRVFVKPCQPFLMELDKVSGKTELSIESASALLSEQSKLDREFIQNPDGSCYVRIMSHSYRVEPHWFWPEFADGWEESTWSVFSRYLKKDMPFLDVGAWVGPTVLYAASLGAAKIVAVEANPASAAHLAKTVSMNPGLADRVEVINSCVCNRQGRVCFGNADGSHALSSASSLRGYGFEVEAARLGDIIRQNSLEFVPLIKIDIEGAELQIVEDLRLLSRRSNLAIHLSLHPPFWQQMGDPAALWDALREFNIRTPQDAPMSIAQVMARCNSSDPYPPWGTPFGNFFEIVLLSVFNEAESAAGIDHH